MNDSQLIELVLESPIDDLTLQQIRAIRARLSESPALREALSERLQMDHHLVDVLGASGDTPDQFVNKILRRKQRQSSSMRRTFVLALMLLILIGIGIGGVQQFLNKKDSPQAASNAPVPTTENQPQENVPAPSNPADGNPMPADPDKPENERPSKPSEPDQVEETTETIEIDFDQMLEPVAIKPISFAHLTALPDADDRASITRSQFDSWFVKASEKLPANVREFRDGDRPQLEMKGWHRLRGKLPAGTAIRFELSHLDQMRFHFYCGDSGVSIVKHRNDYAPWYAYAMQAGEDGIRPTNFLLAANDGYREFRGPARHYHPVSFYFDHQTSELVFYRGDVEAIRTPLPSPPDRIYFEGNSVVRQIDLWPVESFPQPEPNYPIQASFDRPADLAWQPRLAEGASIEKTDDGSLSILTHDPKDHSWTCLPMPGYGVRLVELKLSGVDRSHGIFLAQPANPPEEGQPLQVPSPQDGLLFNRNPRTGHNVARFTWIWDNGAELTKDPFENPSPEVGDQVWVRLLAGGDQIRGWISLDGEHWALLSTEDNDAKGIYNQIGIAASKREGDHRITLEKLVVRELPGLTGLFPKEHWEKVEQIPWKQLGDSPYREDTFKLPDGSEMPADLATRIRRYCGTGASLDHMNELTEEALAQARDVDHQKQIIKEMLALTKTWPLSFNEKKFIERCCDRLSAIYEQDLYTDQRQPYDAFRRELFSLPTMNRDPMGYFSQERFNAEILAAIQQERFDDILNNCETLKRYYTFDPRKVRRDFPIINWAGGIAVRNTGRSAYAQQYLTEGRSTSLLVEDLSKEAYNISAELNAALESGAIADACRLITQIPESAAEGLAPSASDPDHFFSVPAAIQMAVQSHQQLQQQMEDENADLAQLRVNSAIQRGDRKVVELVTLQFFDTQAAAQAHLWLGDQATAAGDFATSLQHYLKAARSAQGQLKTEVATRLQMLGHVPSASTQNISGDVSLGENRMPAKRLVDQTSVIRRSARPTDEPDDALSQDKPGPVWPADAKLNPTQIVLRGMWGRDKDRVPLEMRETHVDWRGRDLGMTILQDHALVTNRFELWKLDLKDSKEVWRKSEKDKDRGRAHDFPFTQVKPLVVGDLIVVRMLHEKGFALYGFDRESGELRWTNNLDDQMVLATDPVSVQGRVLLVTLREVSQSTYAVRLSRVDLQTGEILDSHPLFRIRDSWFDRAIGNLVLHHEQLLIDLGGVLASCDISGHLQWVRKQLTYPQQIDNRWTQQELSNIQIVGDQAIAFHAGMLRMECFDIATGHLRWTMPAVEVQSIRLIDNDRLLVEEPDHWKIVSPKTGKQISQLTKPSSLLSWSVTPDAIVGLQWPAPDSKDPPAPVQVLRIDLKTGETKPLQTIENSSKDDLAAGPLFYAGEKWYLWFQEKQDQDERKLLRLE